MEFGNYARHLPEVARRVNFHFLHRNLATLAFAFSNVGVPAVIQVGEYPIDRSKAGFSVTSKAWPGGW